MSMSFSANQFDNSYKPSRLGNWEVPAATRRAAPVARGPGGTTKIICDNNGHLLPGKSTKKGSSFPATADEIPSYRWPDNMGSSTHKYGGGATMGYKGVQTDFLPISSVYVKLVPGTREYPYGQPV